MGADIIPYEPYHPHLLYTLVVSFLAWLCFTQYGRRALQSQPWLRTMLYSAAIVLPVFAELGSYLIVQVRPAPDTPLGYTMSHFHASFVEQLPIDSFLSPTIFTLSLVMLVGLATISLMRFIYGSRQLNRAVRHARLLQSTEYDYLIKQLLQMASRPATLIPPIFLCDVAAPLAFTTGIMRPRIYVTPALVEILTAQEMVAVLCHEWAHVLRRDTLWNWFVRLLRDVVWFLPGSHLAWQSMLASQDEACDALAVKMMRQPLALARALIKVAGIKPQTRLPLLLAASPFALAGPHSPRERVEHMIRLHEQLNRPRWREIAGGFALLFLFTILSVLPVLLGS